MSQETTILHQPHDAENVSFSYAAVCIQLQKARELYMKNKKFLSVALGGILCFSFASLAYAQEKTADKTPSASQISNAETSTEDIFFQDINGDQISTDGKNWLPQSDYEKDIPEVEWWTAKGYEKWILEQKKELESLIGSDNGWYDGQGTFHKWTRESVDAAIADYYQILEEIKGGALYSKDSGDGDCIAMIPPVDEVVSSCSVIIDTYEVIGQ